MQAQNVLLVEDDAGLSDLVGGLLTEAGYHTVTIADHALIGEVVERWQPRCVILDGELRSTGESRTWDDAAAIRRGHPTVPLVIFSADNAALAEARAGRSERSRAAGFSGFVGKPFVVEDLLATVQSVMAGPASPAAPALRRRRDDAVGSSTVDRPIVGEADLFTTVVHELRQPLTVIRGQLQLGQRQIGRDPSREGRAIDLAIAQVDRMGRLLAEMLDPLSVASNGLSLKIAVVDLAAVIADAIGRFEDGDAQRISFEWPHGTAHVRGDPERIAQILDNLLSNALKYSAPRAPIEVSLTIVGAEAQVRIADHGLGIPEDERARLFTPFYRTSTARDVPGSGLGLHISKRLAERQGGRLWLEASSSAGSVFALELSVAIPERGSH
ncbi:MAG TPA: ATP-binding protein [Candidatus Limnocylindria bacterium]|nr:ATP-binding protein [Candidatus Limnocylindria bacterium]